MQREPRWLSQIQGDPLDGKNSKRPCLECKGNTPVYFPITQTWDYNQG